MLIDVAIETPVYGILLTIMLLMLIPIDANIGDEIKLVPIWPFDWKYRGMILEEIYDDLFKQAEEEGRVIEVESLDVHLDREAGDDEGALVLKEKEILKVVTVKVPAKYTAEEKEQIAQEFKNATMQASTQVQETARGVKRVLDKLLNPNLIGDN